jgi:hypothetical protein
MEAPMTPKMHQKARIEGAGIVLACILSMFLLGSCVHLPFFGKKGPKTDSKKRPLPKVLKSQLGDAQDQLSDIQDQVQDTADSQRTLNSALREEATHIHENDPEGTHENAVENVAKAANQSDDLMGQLDESSLMLESTRTDLLLARDAARDLEKQVSDQEKAKKDLREQNVKLQKELDAEKDSKQGVLKKILIAMTAVGFGAVGVCVFLFFNTGRVRFLYGAAGCLATSALAMTFFVYFTQITVACIILVALLVGLGVWQAWEHIQEKKSKDRYKRASEEVVATVEHLKKHIPAEKTTTLFGDENTDGEVGHLQPSPHTHDIVKAARLKHHEKNKPLRA